MLYLRMYRIVVCILIAGIATNISGCRFFANETHPKLEESFTKEFENDSVDFVVPYGNNGFICAINSNELLVFDKSGNEIAAQLFDQRIVAINAEAGDGIVVSLDNNEVITYSVTDTVLTEKSDHVFDDCVVDIEYVSYPYDITLVVLDNGELYGSGCNWNGILDPESAFNSIISSPILLANDIVMVSNVYALNGDNQIEDIAINETFDANLINVSNIGFNSSGIMVVSGDKVDCYSIYGDFIETVSTVDDRCFSCTLDSYLYSSEGIWYYSGRLSAKPKDKGISESIKQPIELPDGYNYQVISAGVVGYDEHTVICYSV